MISTAPTKTVEVTVNPARSRGRLHRSEKYINTSLRYAPPPAILERAARHFGPFKIARIFLTLDEYWDYRDDSFHPNYRIGRNRYAGDTVIHPYDRARTRESQVDYLDYVDGVAARSEELLLCVRRYEHEVTRGVITREKYEDVLTSAVLSLKRRHPQLRYLEALNESTNNHFGGLDGEGYYAFYRSFCRVAARVNAERLPGPEIGVGGPVTDKAKFDLVGDFLRRYQADKDPVRRLDFISYHDYASGDKPVRVAEMRARLDAFLRESGQRMDMPVFITEMGTHEGKQGGNPCMAAGVPALFEQVRRQGHMIAFPWCVLHDPEIQLWSTQHWPDGRMTPHGMAMALLALHRRDELHVAHDGEDADGLGVYALASADEGAMCVHVWNYSRVRRTVRVRFTASSGAEGFVRYRLDDHANNTIADAAHPGKLLPDGEVEVPGEEGWTVTLEPYAHVLWLGARSGAKRG